MCLIKRKPFKVFEDNNNLDLKSNLLIKSKFKSGDIPKTLTMSI